MLYQFCHKYQVLFCINDASYNYNEMKNEKYHFFYLDQNLVSKPTLQNKEEANSR